MTHSFLLFVIYALCVFRLTHLITDDSIERNLVLESGCERNLVLDGTT